MKNIVFLAVVLVALWIVSKINPQLSIVILPFYFKAIELIAKNFIGGKHEKNI